MQKPSSSGIVITGGYGNVASGNTVIGFETGIHLEGGTSNLADSNLVISPDAAQLYAQLETAILDSGLPADQSARLSQALAAMRQSTGQAGFAQKYRDFMAVLADHMQVLGPVVAPLLPGLAALL